MHRLLSFYFLSVVAVALRSSNSVVNQDFAKQQASQFNPAASSLNSGAGLGLGPGGQMSAPGGQNGFRNLPNSAQKCDKPCYHGGQCLNGLCYCPPGWIGSNCENCFGRMIKSKSTGFITDGPFNYTKNMRCVWILSYNHKKYGHNNANMNHSENMNINNINKNDQNQQIYANFALNDSEEWENESFSYNFDNQLLNKSIDNHKNHMQIYLILKINEFTTEFGWDNLYIYDGDGVFSKQLAVLSGYIPSNEIRTYILKSGQAYLFFSSDVAYNMSGFNITYKFSPCENDCNNRGVCNKTTGYCSCYSNYTGRSCDQPLCSSSTCHNGYCSSDNRCNCRADFRGPFCNISSGEPTWLEISPENDQKPISRAGHAMISIDKSIFIVGGYNFDPSRRISISKFNISSNAWQLFAGDPDDLSAPLNRYDHSIVHYEGKLFMYGGVLENRNITCELWSFDLSNVTWQKITPYSRSYYSTPYHAHGHTSHVITTLNVMLIFFGYNPYRGYLNVVQEFNFANKTWSVLETYGAKPPGLYGHSSVYDSRSNLVYVFGGYGSVSHMAGKVYDNLYSYHVTTRKWTMLRKSGFPSFLNSMVLLNNMLIIVGGHAQNESSTSKMNSFADNLLIYDTDCGSWHTLDYPEYFRPNLAIFGHQAVSYKNEMYIFGGFNGQVLNKLLKFIPGECSSYRDKDICLNSSKGTKCGWYKNRCMAAWETEQFAKVTGPDQSKLTPQKSVSLDANSNSPGGVANENNNNKGYDSCRPYAGAVGQRVECQEYYDCPSCTSSGVQPCYWCNNECVNECANSEAPVSYWKFCPLTPTNCSQFFTCISCKLSDRCTWDRRTKMASPTCIETNTVEKSLETTAVLLLKEQPNYCTKPCSFLSTCEECSKSGCIWCSSMKRCVDTNTYITSFPYGQCTQWSLNLEDCIDSVNCQLHLTCRKCQLAGPRCGWCDDGSKTGLGRCYEGGLDGPVQWDNDTRRFLTNQMLCPKPHWFFTTCPACQCNGHAVCISPNESTTVRPTPALSTESTPFNARRTWPPSLPTPLSIESGSNFSQSDFRKSNSLMCSTCSGKTNGEQCEVCIDGYYGNALNGGNCSACECNNHATSCNPYTGKCYCSTKGIIGHNCEKCDNKYTGNPINSTCYYELLIDFVFTFNLNNEDDSHVTRLNFISRPMKPDTDVTFKVTCSSPYGDAGKIDLNISSDLDKNGSPRKIKDMPCHETERRYNDEEYNFGIESNTTFYVSIHSFRTPTVIQISFAQTPTIDWMKFFVTFALCFFILLVLAFALWKIKQKIDVYRRRQRMFVEMAQMASRPFGSVQLDWSYLGQTKGNWIKQCPSVVSVEPLANYEAAVITVALRMPTGGQKYAANGQSGLTLGSALCYVTPTQSTQLQTTPSPPPERKNKRRRPACIS